MEKSLRAFARSSDGSLPVKPALSVSTYVLPPLPKGEALAVLIRMLKSVYFFLFRASSSIRAIWSSGVVQVPTG